jgi:uncharacterized protein YegL
MSEQVLPFYLVCDESGSMASDIDQMNKTLLPELHESIGRDPVTADKTRFAVIGFAEDARLILPLTDLSELTGMPGLVARGSTSYHAAFELLRSQIETDVTDLKSKGTTVYRPVVFFISDGQPTGEWKIAHDALTDPAWPYRPNIIAFGTDGSDAATISAVGTFKAFMINDGTDPSNALREFASALTKSIVKSGSTVTAASPPLLQVPDDIPGFTALPVDVL